MTSTVLLFSCTCTNLQLEVRKTEIYYLGSYSLSLSTPTESTLLARVLVEYGSTTRTVQYEVLSYCTTSSSVGCCSDNYLLHTVLSGKRMRGIDTLATSYKYKYRYSTLKFLFPKKLSVLKIRASCK